ncbi:MAG: alpha/beta fold hydrolase [Clostridia bacterium]|nr:alpha/beta fold hydrolase [Clostridia bacterium]
MEPNRFLSSDGMTQVAYYFFDDGITKPKAVVQIAHGMQEHMLRYKDLAKELNKHGIVVCGNDHLGHGKTSTGAQTDGFFASKKGAEYVLKDLHHMTQIAKQNYAGVPLFMLGHSMGSFFARYYAGEYTNELNGLILCGTSGRVTGTNLALCMLSCMKCFKGKKSHSKFADYLMTNSYFKYIPDPVYKMEWITSEPDALEKYIQDERCKIKFTVGAYYDMVSTLKKVNQKSWVKRYNKNLPILLVAGAQDPVGQYGKGVCEVYSLFENQGMQNLDLRLYANARHEPFNEKEPTKSLFYNDIIQWLNNQMLLLKK